MPCRRSRILSANPAITEFTTIIVATPSITLITLAIAMYRVRRYRQQSKYLYTTAPSFPGSAGLSSVGRNPSCHSNVSCLTIKIRTWSLSSSDPSGRSLRPHERKQDHVANAGLVQEDHAEPVDANAQPAGRGHRVLEGRTKSSSILAIDSSSARPASWLRKSWS